MIPLALNPFDTSGFVPRWNCGQWDQWLGYLTIVSDALIFLAYFAIPVALIVLLIRRRDFPFPFILLLFGIFILSCGLTHLIEVFIFYHPLYRLNAYMKAVTAVASLLTAGVLIRALPAALSLPSIQRANEQLSKALDREQALSSQLGKIRDELEVRSAQMTSRMRRITDALTATSVVAARWHPVTGEIDWEIGFAAAAHNAGLGHDRTFNNWISLLPPESWAELSRKMRDACEHNTRIEFSGPVAGVPGVTLRLGAHPDPQVTDQPRLITGMFRFIPAVDDLA